MPGTAQPQAQAVRVRGKLFFFFLQHSPHPCTISLYTAATHCISITPLSRGHCHHLNYFQNNLKPTYSNANTPPPPMHTQTHTVNPFSLQHTDNGLTPSESPRRRLPTSQLGKHGEKTDKKRQHHINVSACHGVRFKCTSRCLLLHINFKVISEWLHVVVRDPRRDGERRAEETEQRCKINLACRT